MHTRDSGLSEPSRRSVLVGVVPAAGRARRLGARSVSKEIEPVYQRDPPRGLCRPVGFCVLERLAESGVENAIMITSARKADVRETFGMGTPATPAIEHIVIESSPSAAYTVSIGTEAAGDRGVALGFPDVLWEGHRAFERLETRLHDGADLVLGLFPPPSDYPTHGVAIRDPDGGRVEGFVPRERSGGLPSWTIAVWRPSFSRLLEREVASRYTPGAGPPRGDELTMTTVFSVAIERGLRVQGVQLSERTYLDIGEPDRLATARRACTSPAN